MNRKSYHRLTNNKEDTDSVFANYLKIRLRENKNLKEKCTNWNLALTVWVFGGR